jgi:hypothetical protein
VESQSHIHSRNCAQQRANAFRTLHNYRCAGLLGNARETNKLDCVAEVDITGDQADRLRPNVLPFPDGRQPSEAEMDWQIVHVRTIEMARPFKIAKSP